MRKCLLVFTFILLSLSGKAQVSYAQFENEKDLHLKTEIAYSLLDKYSMNSLDSLRLISTQLLIIGKENGFDYSKATGEFGFGSYYLRSGEQNKAISSLKSALVFFKSIEDYQLVSEILNEIGNCYTINGEYRNALESYISSLDFGSISKDETSAFNGESGLAKAYYALGDTLKGDVAMGRYIKGCIKFEKYRSISNAYAYLGMIEQDKGDDEESINYFDKSIYYGLKSDSKVQLSHTYTNKAIVFFSIEEYDSSLIFFEKALELRIELNRPRQVCESYFNLASFYIERGEMDKAIVEVENSIILAKKNRLTQDEFDGVELLIYIYGETGDSIAGNKQVILLDDLKKQLELKKELTKDVADYIDEIEVSMPQEEGHKDSGGEPKTWMLFAGALIIVSAGGIIGKSLFR